MGALWKIGFAVALGLGCALTACSGSGMSVQEERATRDKELSEFKEAYDEGKISGKEYGHEERELLD